MTERSAADESNPRAETRTQEADGSTTRVGESENAATGDAEPPTHSSPVHIAPAPVPERTKENQRHFAPYDLTDGRERYDWPSRWPRRAQFQITIEAAWLFATLAIVPYFIVKAWTGDIARWFDVPDSDGVTFETYALAWLGGLLGGTSFSMKWLYHSVAKGSWHSDRLLWRFSIPPLSASVAVAVTALTRSGLLPLVDVDSLDAASAALGFGFLAGYFSDHAIGALLRLAQKIFGDARKTADGPHTDDRR